MSAVSAPASPAAHRWKPSPCDTRPVHVAPNIGCLVTRHETWEPCTRRHPPPVSVSYPSSPPVDLPLSGSTSSAEAGESRPVEATNPSRIRKLPYRGCIIQPGPCLLAGPPICLREYFYLSHPSSPSSFLHTPCPRLSIFHRSS